MKVKLNPSVEFGIPVRELQSGEVAIIIAHAVACYIGRIVVACSGDANGLQAIGYDESWADRDTMPNDFCVRRLGTGDTLVFED